MGHHRRSIRLPGYDYSQPNAYFVTICARRKECLFGEVTECGEMRLNAIGQIVEEEWLKSSNIREEIELDQWIVMPNHLHGIVWIIDGVGAHGVRPVRMPDPIGPSEGVCHTPLRGMSKSLGACIGGFKSATSKRIHAVHSEVHAVWQRNYYERVIRSDRELEAVRRYISENPIKWALDTENPAVGAGLKPAPT